VVSKYNSSGSGKESSGARDEDELPPNGERDSEDAAVVRARRLQEASKIAQKAVGNESGSQEEVIGWKLGIFVVAGH
jgi:hypothetical protein